jgi:hypothetical protein
MKSIVRLVLMHAGVTLYDFEAAMIKPEMGEIISIGIGEINQQDFKVEFIQSCFDKDQNYKYLLVTGVKR